MAILTFLPEPESDHKKQKSKLKQKQQKQSPTSWHQIKNILTCKQVESGSTQVHDPSKKKPGYSKLGSSCSSICSFRDVVYGNARIVHRDDNSPKGSLVLGHQDAKLLSRTGKVSNGSSTRSTSRSTRSNSCGASYSSGPRGMQFRKLSGCYECRSIVDPSRYPIPRSSICSCPECGELFRKIESLELHQGVRHAVSELGPEDSGRNIVEIIFKSSWLKKDSPICKIERILKVHNTQRTIQRFEDCREAVKTRALNSTRKNPRCAADGNELLRFHCTSLSCELGEHGSSSLCGSVPGCGVCTIIRQGFQAKTPGEAKGVRTTASSGRAHDMLGCSDGRRAMIVCRVIAGRLKRVADDAAAAAEESVSSGGHDSVCGYAGMYSNLEELIVFNPRAILPCFVLIYDALN